MSPRSPSLTEWSHLGDHAHFVQFYDDELVLAQLLGSFVGGALVVGDAAVVIARAETRRRLGELLLERGFDLRVPEKQGRYIPLDAESTLNEILRAGWPDPVRAQQVLDPLLTRASSGGRRVAAFGEMVALLCNRGNVDAAIRLEELWNEMAEKRNFSLCCAYPMQSFSRPHDAAPFVRICAQHTHVFSASRADFTSSLRA